ncbi:hypothetical protein ACFWY9_30605 [Amycolatopsis sp. NPDC059027]|uniref:hypothetical protein n=1 Tax=Amycolatopsis sp. NPDC059027 TaxID=3346709 RepID=UPI00366CDDA4
MPTEIVKAIEKALANPDEFVHTTAPEKEIKEAASAVRRYRVQHPGVRLSMSAKPAVDSATGKEIPGKMTLRLAARPDKEDAA